MPCILENQVAVLHYGFIVELSAALVVKNACNKIVTMSHNEHPQRVNRASTERQQSVNRASTERQQSVNRASTERQQSVNDFWSCILDIRTAIERREHAMNLSAAFIG